MIASKLPLQERPTPDAQIKLLQEELATLEDYCPYEVGALLRGTYPNYSFTDRPAIVLRRVSPGFLSFERGDPLYRFDCIIGVVMDDGFVERYHADSRNFRPWDEEADTAPTSDDDENPAHASS